MPPLIPSVHATFYDNVAHALATRQFPQLHNIDRAEYSVDHERQGLETTTNEDVKLMKHCSCDDRYEQVVRQLSMQLHQRLCFSYFWPDYDSSLF